MNLTQGLHRAAQHDPAGVSTICGPRVRTHAETLDRVARLAGALQGLGLRTGGRAAILSLNSDRYVESACAALWAGGVVVPVNTRWSVPEIVDSLVEIDARILVVDDAFAAMAEDIRSAHPRLQHVVHAGDGPAPAGMLAYEELVAAAAPVEDAYRHGDDLAAILFTGGTTGRSKGVMLSHANMMTSIFGCLATEQFLTPGGTFLMVMPMFHVGGLGVAFAQVTRGGRQVIMPGFDPLAVLEAIPEHRITDLGLVPTMIQMLVDHERVEEFDLTSVGRVFYGASPISEGLLQRAMKTMPEAAFSQLYGMTELAPSVTFLSPEDHDDPVRRRSAGRPLAHVQVRVVDKDGAEVPRGATGEIVVRGGNVMLGYWERPVETAEALRGGWMHTGDGGYMDDDGFVYICDRMKDMIISGGENVYSAEVESVLSLHPAVAMCAVIGVPDERWGERVHAVVVPVAGGTITLPELRAFCAERIAGYKTPRSMELVEAMPLSAAGKVLKTELRKPHWDGHVRAVS
ncbi:long-chain-fatty-acid--CoA ligase [Geodermatophilus sp. SYSU D00815]